MSKYVKNEMRRSYYHLTEATGCPIDLPSAPPFKNLIKHTHRDWKYHTDHVNISISSLKMLYNSNMDLKGEYCAY